MPHENKMPMDIKNLWMRCIMDSITCHGSHLTIPHNGFCME